MQCLISCQQSIIIKNGEIMNEEKSYKDASTFLEKSISITKIQI